MQVLTDMSLDSLSDRRADEALFIAGIDAWDDFGTFDYDFTCDFNQADQPHPSTLQTAPFPVIPEPELSITPSRTAEAKTRVSLACVPCRSRHSRCDAIHPTCSQCHATNRTCEYAKSRRNRTKFARSSLHQQSFREQRHPEREREETRELQTPPAFQLGGDFGVDHEPHPVASIGRSSASISDASPGPKRHSKMMNTYYTSFHRAHPVALPSHAMKHRLQNNEHSLRHLLPAMQFVASHYEVAPLNRTGEQPRIEHVISSIDSSSSNGFTVQAFLLIAIATHSNDDFVYARELLDKAVQLALAIGMNNQSFARDNGEGDPVLEESWRRTWWLLYMTDGILSRIRHCSTFSLHGVRADVDLPCEEALYHAGTIPEPISLDQYHAREFSSKEIEFSSFAYLIDLGHITESTMALDVDIENPVEPDLIAADTRLVNWALHLPASKRLQVEDRGEVDEILFQAHMLYSTLNVYLHRPRSQLSYCAIEYVSKCTPPNNEALLEEQQRVRDFHTTKVLEAAREGIGLFTLPGPCIAHSPLLICGVSLTLLAEISACRSQLHGDRHAAGRERVRLGLGVLKAYGKVWSVGNRTLTEIQTIAREMLRGTIPGEVAN